jgi:hypothetical protein
VQSGYRVSDPGGHIEGEVYCATRCFPGLTLIFDESAKRWAVKLNVLVRFIVHESELHFEESAER